MIALYESIAGLPVSGFSIKENEMCDIIKLSAVFASSFCFIESSDLSIRAESSAAFFYSMEPRPLSISAYRSFKSFYRLTLS